MLTLGIKKGILSIYIIFILITVGFIGFFVFEDVINDMGYVEAVTIYIDSTGGGDYTSIQSAVDDAKTGDTIIVENGTYYESVTIDKENISLIGKSQVDCRIIHQYSGTNFDDFAAGINITANGVCVSGFNISVSGNWTYGVFLDSINYSSVFNNTISTCGNKFCPAINLMYSNYNYIINNNIISINGSVGTGIWIYVSIYNTIFNNLIQTRGSGIYSLASYNNIIENTLSGCGIHLKGGYFNNILKNNINTTKKYGNGIYLYQSKNNSINSNFIITSGIWAAGIYFYKFSNDNNKLINNTIITSGQDANCISIINSDNTLISNCKLLNSGQNGFGIYLDSKTALVINTTISTTGAGGYDFWIENDGEITAINSSFKTIQLTKYGGGSLYIKNYLDVQVFDDDGISPLPGVDVEIKDNNDIVYSSVGYGGNNSTTNTHGRIKRILVMDRGYNHNNNAIQNITSVSVKKFFDQLWEVVRPNVNMKTSHTEVFYHDITPPPIPTGLKIERINRTNNLNISWHQNIDTKNYEIQTNKSGQWKILYNITYPRNWTLAENLLYNNWYYYRLRAWDKVDLCSGLSTPVGFYLEENKPPKIPSGLKAKPILNDDAINISWEQNIDFTSYYDLWWKNPTNNTWVHVQYIPYPTNYYNFRNNTLANGSKYEFKIRAWDDIGLSSQFSLPIEVIHRDFIPPTAPLNLTAVTISQSIIKLVWNHSLSQDIEGYRIYLNHSGNGSIGTYIFHREVSRLSSTKEITNLVDDTIYYFAIAAFDEANNTSPYSNIAWNTTMAFPILPKVKTTLPAHNSTNIAVNSSIIITFNVPMNIKTVEKVITISPNIEYNLSWTENNTELQIDFIKDLSYNTSYIISIGMAKSETDFFLKDYPFILQFITIEEKKVKPQIFKITILYPKNGTIIKPGELILVKGNSMGFMEGIEVNVTLDSIIEIGVINSNRTWSVTIKAPDIEGYYTITVSIGNTSDSVSIIIRDSDKIEADGDENKKDKYKGLFGWGLIMDLIIFIGIIILIIVFFMVMKKKQKDISREEQNSELENNKEIKGEEEEFEE